MENAKKMSKKEQSKSTIARLLQIAMQEFSDKGYAKTSTEEIVKKAKVTRGALYHHFRNKQDLFLGVFRQAQYEIGRRIEEQAEKAHEPWDQLVAGCDAFLQACSDPTLQQIVVIDAPSVLDWNSYRQADESMQGSGISLLHQCLADLIRDKVLQPLPVEALTHILSGAMDEAAVWVAQSDRPEKALEEAQIALRKILQGIRC